MENVKKIVYIASECQPFFASGGLGDVVGSLPAKIVKEAKGNIELKVILPLYSKLNNKYTNKLIPIGQTTVLLSWRRQYLGIYKYFEKGVTYYFIDNEYYFKRDNFYGYFDDAERFAYFSKASIQALIFLNEIPDIIHCHDWQTGMVPVYLRTLYYNDDRFKSVKTMFTIHNIEYQGKYNYDQDIIEDVFGLSMNDAYLLEYNSAVNIMKGACECSNLVSTVSPSYAKEILTKEYASGLEIETNRLNDENKLIGILNGIDKNFYNPLRDGALFEKYDKKDFTKKEFNKENLQKMINLPVNKNIMMIGMVTRLVSHKGIALLQKVLPELMNEQIQLVILGTGDPSYEWYLKDMETRYKNKFAAILAFNQDLSRKIYASSDLFLMPSLSEPCGLSQMIAARYGSIPLVRRTGGLKDSIIDFSVGGNGYTFDGQDPAAFLQVIKRAINDYQDKEKWAKQVELTMKSDFGWSTSAKKYIQAYKTLENVKK